MDEVCLILKTQLGDLVPKILISLF